MNKPYNFKLVKKKVPTLTIIGIKGEKGDKGDTYDHTPILNDIENLKQDTANNKSLIDSANEKLTNSKNKIDSNKESIDNINSSLKNYALVNESGNRVDLSIDSEFRLIATLYDKNNNLISTSSVIDLPIESLVANVSYDEDTKEIIVTLENGTETKVPVSSLVRGLVNDTDFNALENRVTNIENKNFLEIEEEEEIEVDESE